MVLATSTSFDLEAFRRGYEEWDIDALLALYADEVELIQIDRDNPPSAPRVRHGKEMSKGMLEHRAAATVTCEFPGGRKVVANGTFELEDARIVRERQVMSGDPK